MSEKPVITVRDVEHPHWFGYLTIENCERIASRLRDMLTGKRYVWVSTNSGYARPEVRANLELRDLKYHPPKIGTAFELLGAHIAASDSYGVWGLWTNSHQDDSWELMAQKNTPYLDFNRSRWGNGVYIAHKAPAGYDLQWIMTVQEEKRDDK